MSVNAWIYEPPDMPDYPLKAQGKNDHVSTPPGIRYLHRQSPRAVVPNSLGTRDWFCGRRFFYRPGWGAGFRMIQAQYIQAHLLQCGPVPISTGRVLVRGPDVGDPDLEDYLLRSRQRLGMQD